MLSMLTLTVLASNIGARYLHRENSILPPVAVPSSDVQKQSKEFDRTILRKGISQRDEDNNKIVLRGKDGGDGEMILIYKIHFYFLEVLLEIPEMCRYFIYKEQLQ